MGRELSDRFLRWFDCREVWIFGAVFGALFLFAVSVIFNLWLSAREEQQRLRALPPAERAVEKHVMSDGTICYQPRAGWSRPLSCVRGEGK